MRIREQIKTIHRSSELKFNFFLLLITKDIVWRNGVYKHFYGNQNLFEMCDVKRLSI